eukprot:Colp12_sorted_trinity150504_noHs@13868
MGCLKQASAFVALLVCVLAVSGDNASFEDVFLSVPNAGRAFEHLSFYTTRPHVAGTPGDYETAVYTRDVIRSFGIEADLDEHQVLLSYPIETSVSIVEPAENRYNALINEGTVSKDPTSKDDRFVKPYNAYSPSGNVTGQLVYVNYGRKEDFEQIQAMGIDLKGKIVIVRYGELFRGLKVWLAQEHGAVGVLIYSDPADDGFVKGPVYPEGPWRPAHAVQRGSAQFISHCAGDPGKPERCGVDSLIPKIPVQPLSYADAEPLLRALRSNPAPAGWKGGLSIDYNIGPGPAVVNMDLKMRFVTGPIWNVVARIPGSDQPERAVILGNHRDAWGPGGVDPNSGSSSLLEVARGFGTLLKMGWKPKRTLLLCSWDGEEFGLLGSTEFGEKRADQLFKQAVAYINVDSAVSGGILDVSATPALIRPFMEAASRVTDPATGKPLSDVWSGRVGRLGSGSDYTVFLQHLGIASLDMGFKGSYGVYHSVFDSFSWMETQGAFWPSVWPQKPSSLWITKTWPYS